jgi:hypothetical protein
MDFLFRIVGRNDLLRRDWLTVITGSQLLATVQNCELRAEFGSVQFSSVRRHVFGFSMLSAYCGRLKMAILINDAILILARLPTTDFEYALLRISRKSLITSEWSDTENSWVENRVGVLPCQKVFLPGRWKKLVKTGKNRQKPAKTGKRGLCYWY